MLLEIHELCVCQFPEAPSKHLRKFLNQPFDLVMTLCDNANEFCPVWPGLAKREHISFPDPSIAEGADDEKLKAFRDFRDMIKEIIIPRLSK
jgi:arsenate reductase (thioredoxin)